MSFSLPATAIDLIVKVTLVLLSGALVAFALRKASPALRHFTWTLTLAACVSLAILAPLTPRVPVVVPWLTVAEPVTVAFPSAGAVASVSVEAAGTHQEAGVPHPLSPSPLTRRGGTVGLVLVWLGGTALLLLRYAIGQAGLARLRRRAVRVNDETWLGLLDEAARRSGVTQPVWLGWSSEVGTPITWGLRHPIVLLPPNADGWSGVQRRAVLWHEMAHISRGDILSQFVAQIACALFWFHPAVWVAAKRQRAESERACDDRVLVWGTPAHEYATHLIGVARGARELRITGAVSIGMARPSALEGRLLAILDETLRRDVLPSGVRAVGIMCVALLILPLAALRAVPDMGSGEQTPGSVSNASVAKGMTPVGERPAPRSPLPQDSLIEETFDAVSGERLTLDLRTGGNVIIRGWDERRVRVRASIGGISWRDVEVDIGRTPDGVRVRSEFRVRRSFQSSNSTFEIHVPHNFNVSINSGGGELRISNVEGTFEGSTGGGGMFLDRLTGIAQLSIGGGSIEVTDSDLDGTVSTGGGHVKMSRVQGGLRGSSGSGPVEYREGSAASARSGDVSAGTMDRGGRVTTATSPTGSGRSRARSATTTTTTARGSATGASGGVTTTTGSSMGGPGVGIGGRAARGIPGMLHIEKAGGAVRLDEALQGAVIRTGGGDIEVGEAAVLVDASTGGGDVWIGPVAGSVRAGTGSGDVWITLTDARGEPQTVDVWAGNGDVIIEVPRDFDGELVLETAHTRSFGREATITAPAEWIQDRHTGDQWDNSQGTPRIYVRANGVAGKGRGRIHVKTVNGDIEIRRGK